MLGWLRKLKKEKETAPEEPKTVWVQVDAISMYRMRYMAEAPADHPEYALDSVAMEEAKEFSQEWLGETISSHRVLTEQEALDQVVIDNPHLDSWSKETKMKNLFTKIEDQEFTSSIPDGKDHGTD